MKSRIFLSLTIAFGILSGCHSALDTIRGRQHEVTDADHRDDDKNRVAVEDGATASLRIVETTDLHVNLEAFDYYKNQPTLETGLVRAATLVRKARAEVANSLLIDNGDLLQGSPLGDWFKKERDPKTDLHTAFKAMNLLGYDVGNIGNHEFNYGLDFLESSLSGAKYPYISANVMRDDGDSDPSNDKTWLQPYVLLKRTIKVDDGRDDTVTIGVIGFAPPQIMNWDRSNLLGKLTSRDIVDTATALIPQMKAEGADLIIAVPHSGISASPRLGNDENACYYLAQVPGIDAILSGHSHLVFPSPNYANLPNTDLEKGLIQGVPAVMAGAWGSHVGVVDLSLKKVAGHWQVAAGQAEARKVNDPRSDPKDPAGPHGKGIAPADFEADVRDAIAADHQATLTYLQQEIGTTEQPIDSYFSQVQPSAAVSIVQAAQLWYAKKAIVDGGAATKVLQTLPILSASAPLKAGGTPANYTDVPAGKLTLRNVADLYVYPNTIKIVKISGADVRNWLEMAAGAFNQIKPNVTTEQVLTSLMPAYNFDQLLGVAYTIDVSQAARFDKNGKVVNAAAHRIADLTYQGKAVSDAQQFLVVTNNYRANGGGNFPGLDGTKTVLDPGKESREVLRDFVESTGKIAGPSSDTANWKLKPVPGATNVIFTSSPAAKAKVGETNGLLSFVRAGADGWAVYHLNW